MCLIRHLGIVSGQGPHITFEDWIVATPPPTWKDNCNEVDLLCLVTIQLKIKFGLPFDKAYAYVSSLLWRGVQLLSLSNSMDANLIELVGTDITCWSSELLILHRSHMSNIQLATLTAALDVLKQDKHALQQLVQAHAMSNLEQVASLSTTKLPLTLASHREPISSPSPTPTTHKRGEKLKSMSVVSAPSQSAAPLALLSQLHSTQAVLTQSVSMQHTAKQPPQDYSP